MSSRQISSLSEKTKVSSPSWRISATLPISRGQNSSDSLSQGLSTLLNTNMEASSSMVPARERYSLLECPAYGSFSMTSFRKQWEAQISSTSFLETLYRIPGSMGYLVSSNKRKHWKHLVDYSSTKTPI